MQERVTIEALSRQTAVPARTIRFYEAVGVLPQPRRSAAGYRLYAANDVRRLRLARRARLLGLSLPEVRQLVEQAFASDCAEFGAQLLARVTVQRATVDRQIAELQALQRERTALEQHVRHTAQNAQPGRQVAECGFCPLIDDECEGEVR
ncbi:MAG: MerR family transcriptional regulator [Dehalococcoidia bacterium]